MPLLNLMSVAAWCRLCLLDQESLQTMPQASGFVLRTTSTAESAISVHMVSRYWYYAACLSHEYHMFSTWPSHAYHKITCSSHVIKHLSHDHYSAVTCLPYDYHMLVTWSSHAFHMTPSSSSHSPFSSRSSTTAACPFQAALCKGVSPSLFCTSGATKQYKRLTQGSELLVQEP